METQSTPLFRDIARELGITRKEPTVELYRKIDLFTEEIIYRYVQRTFSILDPARVKQKMKKLGSGFELHTLVDKNGEPVRYPDGALAVEFRQDTKNLSRIPESREMVLFSQIVLFLLENKDGNIAVSLRSLQKEGHKGELEMAGGHVKTGNSLLKTVYEELGEELDYYPRKDLITENDLFMKYRNFTPGNGETKGGGNIVSIFRVKVPNTELLTCDPKEIAELFTFSREGLLDIIYAGEVIVEIDENSKKKTIYTVSLDGRRYLFAPHHAYWYLDYLLRIPGMDTQRIKDAMEKLRKGGVMKNRTRLK